MVLKKTKLINGINCIVVNDVVVDDDCVVAEDTSGLDTGAFEYKFFANGVGFFFEVKPDEGETLGITECNVGPKCAGL